MIQRLPPIGELRSLPEAYQTETLDLLFEPSPAIHATLLPIILKASYSSYTDLIERCRVALFELAASSPMSRPSRTLLSIIGSHPRLGARQIDSALSKAEQANLAGEGEHFARMNREYEEKFPGLRFVIFVDGQSRPEILEVMQLRINRGDFTKEVVESLENLLSNHRDLSSFVTTILEKVILKALEMGLRAREELIVLLIFCFSLAQVKVVAFIINGSSL
ncbi:hypothetical protein E4U25_004365 [Claviceps purpurea]|nr:hypothetical protein E4U10_006934 [Claviceps purpurea]KAG6213128.1 hypothetical protein E4U50_001534 [Claviceps purpurea]KAG6242275.1 hypothetical protein E4U25_004365 [Claviceps purpurea]KAG6287858.1 hypothetical protein E4U46_003788 [Claviceps purpurea]